MKKIVELISNFRNLIVYLIFATLSLYLLFSKGFYHQNSFLSTTDKFMGSVYQKTSVVSNYIDLEEKNEALRLELALTKMRLSQNSFSLNNDSILKTDSLRKLQYSFRPAKVINKTTGYNRNYFTIDKGYENGVELDDGVISFTNNLVGRVSKVSEHFSLVTPVINSDFALKVQLKNSKVNGLLNWNGASNLNAQVSEIGKRVNVQVGDSIVSSINSKYFPADITVGIVENIETEGDILNLEIRLAEDPNSVIDVMVVSNYLRKEQELLEEDLIMNP